MKAEKVKTPESKVRTAVALYSNIYYAEKELERRKEKLNEYLQTLSKEEFNLYAEKTLQK